MAYDLVRKICREEAALCDKPGTATMLASAKSVAAVEKLAKSDRRLAATIDQWDADPWVLNTPDGVVDLKTGTIRPHKPDDYATMITATAPGGDCPRWRKFLDEITGGDADLAAFLQRLAGYSLTGSTREHSLAFLYGTGANGKSVFLGTLAGMLGAYAKTAPIETFTATMTDRHPTDLAMLRGARLVSAQETEEDRRWAESRIKSLTGGDVIAARFMRQDFFEFTPQFKLVIAGNHKPGLRSIDEAIRRRFHLVPFTVTIPPEKRDPDLAEHLKAEWPAILAWAIEGCLAWQRDGLAPPESVLAATAHYLEGQDAIAAWIDDCCKRDP
ncbi:MAG TPA: phage/plasmid primase, P4 family, partial [Thermohalobaculum sp.]|nr:phage/plasmid primase, P4 family [Thermohalobaculum sp.]